MDTKSLKEKLNLLLSLLAIVLSISLALNFIQFHKRNKATPLKKELIKSNLNTRKLTTELQNARLEINKYKGISVKLDGVIKEANLKIDQQEKKILTMAGNRKLVEAENMKLTAEIDTLRELYLEVIDSLLIARKINSTLNNNIALMQDRIGELNTRLGNLKRLNTDNITVITLKKDMIGRSNTTALARRTAQVRICFDILPNPVAYSGLETFYIRILNPIGDVLTDSPGVSGSFIHPEFKVEVPYTLSEGFNYKNEKMNVCFNWKESESYMQGLYIVELYTKDYKIGMTTFTLK